MPPEVFIPTDWTPLAALRATMQRAMAADDYRNPHDPEFRAWWLGYLVFWKQDRVELAGRLGSPRAERLLISYPVAERDRDKFELYLFADARLFHHASREMFYDVHVRLNGPERRISAPENIPPAPASTAGQDSAPDTEGMGIEEARARLLEAAWEGETRPRGWTAKQAANAAMKRFGERPALNGEIGQRVVQRAWEVVKRRHPAAFPR